MALAVRRLVVRFTRQSEDWSTRCQDNVTGLSISVFTVLGMILQRGTTLK